MPRLALQARMLLQHFSSFTSARSALTMITLFSLIVMRVPSALTSSDNPNKLEVIQAVG